MGEEFGEWVKYSTYVVRKFCRSGSTSVGKEESKAVRVAYVKSNELFFAVFESWRNRHMNNVAVGYVGWRPSGKENGNENKRENETLDECENASWKPRR